jgi:DNA-directed RNA polymerase specialized sigma24 family protein
VAVTERPPNDERLGELTAHGHAEAFSALYDRHFQGVYDFALRAVRDPDTAAEVVYDSFVRTWAALRKRPVDDVRTSLYAAAFRAAVERTPEPRVAGSEAADFIALDASRLADPATVIRDSDLVALVWTAAAALPIRDYGLLDLQLRKRLPASALAPELGVKRATLDARVARLQDELVTTVLEQREDAAPARVSPLAIFAALEQLTAPAGLQEAIWARVLEHMRRPAPTRWKPSRTVVLLAIGILIATAAGAAFALSLGGGPQDPSDFRSATHEIGVETSDAAIALQWAPEPDATGYSILWSHEPTLPDETVDLAGTASETTRTVTPGQWWFNLRTRDDDGDWTHTVHIGPYVVVPVPDTKIVSRPPLLSNDNRPAFRFEATGEGTFECSLDRAAFKGCEARIEIGRLRDGRHRLQVRIRDLHGNADASPAVWVWRVDTKAPRTRIVSAAVEARTARFRFASSERKSTFECRMDAGDFARCRSPLSVDDLRQGNHVLVVRATDGAGNRDRSPAVYRWEIDTKRPKTTILSGPSGVVHRSRATFALDSNEVEVTYECSLDGRAFTACPPTVTFRVLPPGDHTFAARARDEAGNVDGTPARRRWTIVDTARPNTTITDHPPTNSSDSSPTFRFRSSEAGSTFECRLDSGSWRSCSSPRTYNSLANGQHVFRVRARDLGGNVDQTPATWTWTIH